MPPEITKRPFGFDPIENEEYVKKHGKEETRPIYVDMIVDMKPSGQMFPISFVWEDGREYNVGKVINVRKGHSLKAFAPGLRYLCEKGKRRYYVYFDGERWYLEISAVNIEIVNHFKLQ